MEAMTFNQILHAAERLSLEEQSALITHLQRKVSAGSGRISREGVLAELDRRKAAGAFEKAESLRGAFAHPALDLSFEEIQAIT